MAIIKHISNQRHKMRRKLNRQMNLFTAMSSNPIARELEWVSRILDANSRLLDLVYQDLTRAKRRDTDHILGVAKISRGMKFLLDIKRVFSEKAVTILDKAA